MGCSKPAIIRSVVVLPQPDGPSIEKNSPRRMSKSASSTATNAPNRLVTWSISMTTSSGSPVSSLSASPPVSSGPAPGRVLGRAHPCTAGPRLADGTPRCKRRPADSVISTHDCNGIPCAIAVAQHNIVVEARHGRSRSSPMPDRELHRRHVGGRPRRGHRRGPEPGDRRGDRRGARAATPPTSTRRSRRPPAAFDAWGTTTPQGPQRGPAQGRRRDRGQPRRPQAARDAERAASPPRSSSSRSTSRSTTCASSPAAPGSSRARAAGEYLEEHTLVRCAATRSASSGRSRRGTTRSTWRPGSSARRSPPATRSCSSRPSSRR